MRLTDLNFRIVDMRQCSAGRFTLGLKNVGLPATRYFLPRQLRLQQQLVVGVVGKWLRNQEVAEASRWRLPQGAHHFVGKRSSMAVLKLAVNRERPLFVNVGFEAHDQRDFGQVLHSNWPQSLDGDAGAKVLELIA